MPNPQRMNLNYLLNRAYYESMTHANFGECNKALCQRRFQSGRDKICFTASGFCLKTTYPGLLMGLGNTHAAGVGVDEKEKDGAEIKLGFTLDYVTGLPVIPGSTVKGVLRSAFRRAPDFVAELLIVDETQVKELERAVFEEDSSKIVFFDAIPVRPGDGDRLFGLDNITPHHAKDPAYHGLINPVPITMLKVIPEVVFLFRFGFERWNDLNGVKEDKLLAACTTILTTLGIGAKTNVGFGAMEVTEPQKLYYNLESKMNFSEGKASTPRTLARQQQVCNTTDAIQGPVCRNKDCSNPVAVKRDGTLLPYCSECIQTHNAKKREESI